MATSPTLRTAAVLLVVGMATFLVGAGGWRLAYEQALPQALAAMGAEPKRILWIHGWMILGVVITTAGLVALQAPLAAASSSSPPGRTLATLVPALFAFGAVLGVGWLTFRLTVLPWAAAETIATGTVPAGYEALHRWSGLMYAVHMVLSYTAALLLGLALLTTTLTPAWLAWTAIVFGAVGILSFATLGGRQCDATRQKVGTQDVDVACGEPLPESRHSLPAQCPLEHDCGERFVHAGLGGA